MKTLLYVDDEFLNREMFKINFKKQYKVLIAESADEANRILSEEANTIDAVISDINMPGTNGVEFIKMAHKQYPGPRYYLLTGYDINEEIIEGLKSKQIAGYFKKPLNFAEINLELNK